jgi:hypothetical protein
MGFPYSSGDVLTASDLNASSGLVFIKSQTITSGATNVSVSNAFSSTFDNYRIIVTNVGCTSATALVMRLGSQTSSVYRYVGWYQRWSSSTIVGYGPTTDTLWDSVGRATTSGRNHSVIDIFSPYLATKTTGFSNAQGVGSSEFLVQLNLVLDDTNSYSSFTLDRGSGTLTGGTIRVYGFNNG